MKIAKKILSVFLVVAMLFTAFPVAMAADIGTVVATGKIGNITWKLDNNGVIRFTGKGNMPNSYFDADQPWRPYYSQIKKAVVSEGITNIPYGFFSESATLETVIIPNSVSYISGRAFYRCYALESIVIPNTITKIESYTFYYCTSLKSVYIPKSVKHIDHWAFMESGLKDMYYSGSYSDWQQMEFGYFNSGLNYAVRHYDYDIDAYFQQIMEKEKDENTEIAQNYINQHFEFVQTSKFLNLIENATFYKTIWQYEEVDTNFGAYAAWEIIGDIGEAFTLSFNDLFVFDNPYEAILADLLASCISGENTVSAVLKNLGYAFDGNSLYKDFMSLMRSSENWEDSVNSSEIMNWINAFSKELEGNLIEGIFVSPKQMNLKHKYPKIYDALESIWPDTTNAQWSRIFGGINNVSTIVDYINTSTDVVSTFFDAYQKYVIAKALVTTHQDLLNTIKAAANNMPEKSSKKLIEAIDTYTSAINLDSATKSIMEYSISGSFLNVCNIVKGALSDLIYKGIASMLGIAAVSSINALIITYNTTYAILDSCTGVGGEADMFFLLNAAALFEKSLRQVTIDDALSLINGKSLATATKFDASYGLLQALEQYTYHGFSKYISAMKQEFKFEFNIMSAVGGFAVRYFAAQKLNEKLSTADNAITSAVFFEGEWRNINCHTDNSVESKLVAVKCPTDVYVYDENNTIVMSIINNKIVSKTDKIAAIVDGDEKIFYLPETENYRIDIKGTDTGSMTYSVYDSDESTITGFIEYENIPLIKDCVYQGKLSNDSIDENSYNLSLNKEIPCTHIDENSDFVCDFCGETMENEDTTEEIIYPSEENTTETETQLPEEETTVEDSQNPEDNLPGQDDQSPETPVCKHICHTENAFLKFIWEIYNFLMRIFSMEKYCSCGVTHY